MSINRIDHKENFVVVDKEYLNDKIAKYKIPEFVEFMTEIPRNPSGKIIKHELKKLFP